MPSASVGGFSRTLNVLRTRTAPGANLTNRTLFGNSSQAGIFPCRGWGTLRVHVFSDQAVTLNFFQKPRDVSTSSQFTMRQTDTQSVAASTGTPIEFLITGDYCDLRITTTTAPSAFECEATLYP